ncbi:MAG: ABC transporter permease [Siphonobacter sp.]
MLRNYLIIAWRNLLRNKAFSVLNITGLALGMTCSMLIFLWVQDEKSVDAFHANGEQLYQVYERSYHDGKVEASYSTQGLLAQELKRVIPEVQYASGLEYVSAPGTQNTFEAKDKISKMGGMFADTDFFRMFSYPLLLGTPQTALTEPNVVAISRKMAENFFGSPEKAMGQIIRFDNKEALKVTAVFENMPANSSHQFDFFRSWEDFIQQNKWVNNWSNTSPSTYIQLRPGADAAKVEAKIKDFIYRYQPKTQGFQSELALQPYPEKYLNSNFKNGYIDGGRIEYIYFFTAIAVFVLLIACINFMNLATAQSSKRSKEVGLRKAIGAVRSSLIAQFIGEAVLLAFFSILIALLLSDLLLPAFNTLTGKQLTLPLTQPLFWLSLLGLIVVTGFVSGSYPALFLSSLNTVKVLKGTLKFSWKATFFRQGLVVFQFTLSIMFIIGIIVVYRQMNYIQSKNLGYNRENLVYLPIEGELVNNYSTFKTEAEKYPGIVIVSKMRNSPTVIEHHTGGISWDGKDPNVSIFFADGVVGYDFVKTMKLELKEGRDFSKAFATDTAAYLLNETAVHRMALKDPIGQTISWGNRPGIIIGVLKDFHFTSMHQAIDPLIIRLDDTTWGWGTVLVRTEAGKTQQAINSLEKLTKSLNPKFPFTYRFSDQEFDHLYKSEQVVSQLSNYFAILAITIACLGLFGLAGFTAERRTKEIGVRKVMGASVISVVGLLSKDFLKLVLIAILIASPVAWYAMNHWLQGFAYRISIDWWIFVIAGLASLLIAWLTVSYQSIQAALMNPVKSLKSE